MPVGEREALTGLITMLIVVVLVTLRLFDQHASGAFDGPDALQVWARSILILIGVSIAIAIAVSVLAHILEAVLTGERPDDRRDERDHLIERRALSWAWYLLSFGILAVIVDLAFGSSAFRALNLILALCAGAELVKDGVKLILYRRGS
jgi:heme/copper-type cytochrome/quinol oxidase subunit 2